MPLASGSAAPGPGPLIASPSGPYVIAGSPNADASPRISLVIPTYQEAQHIEPLLSELSAALEEPSRGAYELIVVDDDSPDQTWQRALDAAAHLSQVRVVRRVGERGLSTAILRGWQVARGELLGVIDGDLQHPPEVVAALLRRIDPDYDLAVASRNAEGGGVSDWTMARRVLSRGAQLLGLMVLPGVLSRVSDPMSGYFLVRREAIAGVFFNPLGYKILVEVLGRGRIERIVEVGYVFRERVEGESKVTWRLYVEYLRHLGRLWRARRAERRRG